MLKCSFDANTELKKAIKKDLNVDDIDDLADDMADMMEEMNEINEAMGRNFTTPEDVTEADLEAELDMLEDELFVYLSSKYKVDPL